MSDQQFWTRNETNQLIDLIENRGLSYEKAGEYMGRSRGSVRSKYRRIKGTHLGEVAMESDAPSITRKERLNEMQIVSRSTTIHTVPQLLEYCEVDMEEWRVVEQRIGAWPMGRKDEVKDLEFDEGKITGTIKDSGKIHEHTMIKLGVRLVRKEPIADFEFAFRPIESNFKFKKPKKPNGKTLGTALLVPDIHCGFWREFDDGGLISLHDRQALDVVLQVANDIKPNKIVIMGDGLDLAEWTDKFLRQPELMHTTQPSLVELHWWLAMLRMANVNAEMYYLEGNHELRSTTATITHLKAAYKLKAARRLTLPPALSIPNLLSLDDLGIEWVGDYPNGRVWINRQFQVEHGRVSSSVPGGTARKLVEEYDRSIATGHNHKVEKVSETIYTREGQRDIVGMTCGMLFKRGGLVPAHYKDQSWQQGYGVVYYSENEFEAQVRHIQNGSTILNGRHYEARGEAEIVKGIERDMDYRLH